MEYDRALYRVYERIMEDLNASPSPMTSTSSSSQSSAVVLSPRIQSVSSLRRRSRGRHEDVASDSNGGDDDDLETSSPQRTDDGNFDDNGPASPESQQSTSNNNSERISQPQLPPAPIRRQFSSAISLQQQRRQQPLPFILPIWMARKVDARMNNHPTILLDDDDGTMMVSGFGRRIWNTFRAAITGDRGTHLHGSYGSVATSPSQHSRVPSTPSTALSPIRRLHDSDHEDDDLEEGEGSNNGSSSLQLQLPPLNTDHPNSPSRTSSGVGLRRRSPSRRDQQDLTASPTSPRRTLPGASHPPHSPTSSSPSASVTSVSSPQSSFSGEEGTAQTTRGAAATTTTSLAQRAIQMQMRQNERFSSHGGSGSRRRRSPRVADGPNSDMDTDDSGGTVSDTDSDDDSNSIEDNNNHHTSINEGCSQHNLYGTMRLSFAIAIFHIFVLISLHVTYVGPYAFRKQGRVLSMKQHVRKYLVRSLVDSADSGGKGGYISNLMFRGLLMVSGDGSEGGSSQKDDNTKLINCISYALSTRSVEERSNYFGEEEKNDDSSNGRRLLDDQAYEYELDFFNKEMHNGDELDDDDYRLTRDGATSDGHMPNFGTDAVVRNTANAIHYGDDYGSKHDAHHTPNFGNTAVVGNSNVGTFKHYQGTMREMENRRVAVIQAAKSAATPLFGKDEILQIKIIYGGKCEGRCSRVRNVKYPENITDAAKLGEAQAIVDEANAINNGQRLRGLILSNRRAKEKEENNDDKLSSPSYWEKPHYRFAIDDALLFMDEKSALLHNITLVNVTVTERCLSTGSDDGRLTFLTATGEFLSQIYGMDSVIINQLMYGIRGIDGAFTSGYVKSMETSERWGWHKEQLETFEHHSFFEWVMKKFGVVLMSTLAFFLITSVTSLIVRVLTSSGVVLMFPLFTCFRVLGMPGADERILALSYPWIGSARMAIGNQSVHPQSHLVWAHVTKIILYYVMYEACQAAWSVVLYAKSIPEALPIWIYGFAMIWEYFSMVFVRSALSVHFFPRVTFLYFFLYHVYFYSVPYGYFDIALIPLFLLMLHAMIYTILALEAPNAARGVITVECPREVYNRLSWPEPVAALPAEWTMFLPLNSRLSPLHDREVPRGTATNSNNSEQNADSTGDDITATT